MVIAAGQVRPADGAIEKDVAGDNVAIRFAVETDTPRRMTRAEEDRERVFAQRNDLSRRLTLIPT